MIRVTWYFIWTQHVFCVTIGCQASCFNLSLMVTEAPISTKNKKLSYLIFEAVNFWGFWGTAEMKIVLLIFKQFWILEQAWSVDPTRGLKSKYCSSIVFPWFLWALTSTIESDYLLFYPLYNYVLQFWLRIVVGRTHLHGPLFLNHSQGWTVAQIRTFERKRMSIFWHI